MKVEITQNNTDAVLNALDSQLKAGLEAIGITAEGHAKAKCPVDTGRLRNSITHIVLEDEPSTIIGTNVEYAPFVELGTSKQKAQPYLKPAAENHKSEYERILKSYLTD